MNKRIATLVLATLIVGILVAPTPAHARPSAEVFTCNMHFATFPGSGSSSCSGTKVGVDVANPTACLTTCPFIATASFFGETCVAGEFPLIGTGEFGGHPVLRVGLVALFTPPDATGAFAIVPLTTPLPTCENPGPLNVQLVGAMVLP